MRHLSQRFALGRRILTVVFNVLQVQCDDLLTAGLTGKTRQVRQALGLQRIKRALEATDCFSVMYRCIVSAPTVTAIRLR